VAALHDALIEKGHFHEDPVGGVNDWFEHEASPMSGAKVVARAWTDPAYRERLLADGTAAIAELGISGPEGAHMVVVENTPGPQRHRAHALLLLPGERWRDTSLRRPGRRGVVFAATPFSS
jgi:hypothetical protein